MGGIVGFGLAISEEVLGDGAPVLLQGGLTEAMEKAAALGFDNVEIQIRNPLEFDAEGLLDTARRHRLTISAVGTGLEYSLNSLSLTSPDRDCRRRMAQRYREHIDLAARLGAVVFVGLCRGKAPDFISLENYLDRFYEELVPIAVYAREQGVILALEPIVFYLTNLLNTTEEALQFLERPGLGDVELLLDTHHMFIEDRNMVRSFRACRDRIAHIHISDSNRRYPGGGNVDYDRVGKTLKEIEYDRAVSLEVVPYPNGEEAARRGIAWMRSIWEI